MGFEESSRGLRGALDGPRRVPGDLWGSSGKPQRPSGRPRAVLGALLGVLGGILKSLKKRVLLRNFGGLRVPWVPREGLGGSSGGPLEHCGGLEETLGELAWIHSGSLGVTRAHSGSLGFTRGEALWLTRAHSGSLGLNRVHSVSLGFSNSSSFQLFFSVFLVFVQVAL